MEADFPESAVVRLSEFVSRAMGLHFPRERWPELWRAVGVAARELGFEGGAMECTQRLVEASSLTKQQFDILVDRLTVGETYFFRERRHFDFLAERVIPELLRRDGDRRIRLWCAGCCTGEEAYSIAIALRRAVPDLERWQVMVLATDINERFLRRAEAGVYGPWSFRNVPEWLKASYFHARPDGQLEILPEIKRMVRFARLNLAEDVYPSLINDIHAMDVIFCRNVLMYFTPAQARRVVERMYRVQREDGWLFVGSSELLHLSSAPYSTITAPELVAFRKMSGLPTQGAQSTFRGAVAENGAQAISSSALPVSAEPEVVSSADAGARAAMLFEAGQYDEAVGLLRALLEPSPQPDPERLVLLARCLANQGRLSEALRCCDQAVAADACNIPAQYLRALVQQEQGAVAEAISSLRRTLFLDPHFVLAHVALGTLARDRGDASGARKHLHHALEILLPLNPTDVLSNSEGMTAGQLMNIVYTLVREKAPL